MKADKSFEPDAKKPEQKQLWFDEQDVEKKAGRQFKGLFDKMPGEITDTGTDNRGRAEYKGKPEES
uniref:Uncharacterized protein n=1 Tax=Salix viminalis TaxID=40686 RepID=A0A6N2KJ44_SALVM